MTAKLGLRLTDWPEEDPDLELGRRLRRRRVELGLSLRQLADLTGLSTASLSQIERTLSTPSLRSLRTICAALEMSMGELFSEIEARPASEAGLVVRAGARRTIDFGEKGMTKELLTPDSLGDLQAMVIRIRPGCGSGEAPLTDLKGARGGLVSRGVLGLEVDGRRFVLNEGDSFGFRAQEGLRFWCEGIRPCEVIWLASPAIY